jgi:DNA mismatch endonuclease (patch repair protein)
VADIVDAATRSRMMSGIRGTNTAPERLVRSALHRRGFRFRLHAKELPGRPDIVLPRYRAVVLVNGCFWHGHACSLFRLPGTRTEFWADKLRKNRENDARNIARLVEAGWRVAIVWECAIRGRGALDREALGDRLGIWLRGGASRLDVSGTNEGRNSDEEGSPV